MKAWLLSAVLMTGCYEGWDQGAEAAKNAPQVPPLTPPAATVYGYILFQPISMMAAAAASETCFPLVGIASYKVTEWSQRISAISAALGSLADQVVVAPVQIAAADCTQLASVQAAALNATPWGDSPAPTASGSSKPRLHLTAAFWEGEPALTPPALVTRRDWVAWQALQAAGLKAKSLHYFSVSNPINGYFTQWEAAETGASLDATRIDQVDPTDSGTVLLAQTISTDTQALVSWLTAQGKVP